MSQLNKGEPREYSFGLHNRKGKHFAFQEASWGEKEVEDLEHRDQCEENL